MKMIHYYLARLDIPITHDHMYGTLKHYPIPQALELPWSVAYNLSEASLDVHVI